jgi:hypothetical protein
MSYCLYAVRSKDVPTDLGNGENNVNLILPFSFCDVSNVMLMVKVLTSLAGRIK